MTEDTVTLLEALQRAGEDNFLHSLTETVRQILMEANVEELIGAGRYKRSGERSYWRSGYHDRSLDSRLGHLNLRDPRGRRKRRRRHRARFRDGILMCSALQHVADCRPQPHQPGRCLPSFASRRHLLHTPAEGRSLSFSSNSTGNEASLRNHRFQHRTGHVRER
ncbi:hypothetical protein FHG71_20415 [Rubellimicrobium roseum]|uniref:Transposase n=1 Tax=Rubellimicrobium roseum TaxID=687525 RepID=A0A5C4NAD0_9RHOB|nr:hypothetical protein FHG71_20415 [Rubellimicrobium roseum]